MLNPTSFSIWKHAVLTLRPCPMTLLKAIFNILNHWRGVIEDDVEERGDEGIQQVETLTEMPRIGFLLVQTSA